MPSPCCICKSKINLHRFPKDEVRKKLWIQELNLHHVKPVTFICSKHFEVNDFLTESYKTGLRHTKKILKKDAVPSLKIKNYQEELMDTQLHSISDDAEAKYATTITNYQNVDEIYIKEELLEENPQAREFFENIFQTIKKEEYNKQIDKDHDNPIVINNYIVNTENTKSDDENFEEIFIKEELGEEISLDSEFYENEPQSIKREDDNDRQIDKACDKTVILTNDSRRLLFSL